MPCDRVSPRAAGPRAYPVTGHYQRTIHCLAGSIVVRLWATATQIELWLTIIIVDYVFNVVATAIAGAIDFPYYKGSNDLYLHN